MRKIALEEHFITDEMLPYLAESHPPLMQAEGGAFVGILRDLGEQRLAAMDKAGVEFAVLSLGGPGVQLEPDAHKAVTLAKRFNDELAAQIQKNPKRYGGFAHLPTQDAEASAAELERCVRDLGLQGALINGHTNGVYLDDPRYEALWERAAALNAPLYLHPNDPVVRPVVFDGHPALWRAVWNWTMETSSHALRLVFGGVFERHPGATLIVGHMGEGLPFGLWRFDSRSGGPQKAGQLPNLPSFYIKRNIAITTSGMFDDPPLACSLAALGEDRVMFSVDYPFEDIEGAARWIDEESTIPEAARAKVCWDNARTILSLQDRL